VTALPAVLALLCDLGEPWQLARRPVGLVGGQHALVGHGAQDVGVPLLEVALGLLALGGVEVVRVVDDAREHRGLLEVELGGLDAEVRPGGGLDAVGAAAEVDGVEVALEDLLLGDVALELQGDEGLLDLAREGLLLGEVEDLHVLLRDRRRALRRAALGVVERGPDDALRVDAAVGPERRVLPGHDGVLDGLGHLVERDGLPVLGGELPELVLAVRVVDERRLGLEVLVGVGHVDRLVEEDEPGHRHERADEAEDQQPLAHPAPPAPGGLGGGLGGSGRLLGDSRAGGPALSTHVLRDFRSAGRVRRWFSVRNRARGAEPPRRAPVRHRLDISVR
jgi:hypothetical protein